MMVYNLAAVDCRSEAIPTLLGRCFVIYSNSRDIQCPNAEEVGENWKNKRMQESKKLQMHASANAMVMCCLMSSLINRELSEAALRSRSMTLLASAPDLTGVTTQRRVDRSKHSCPIKGSFQAN